MAFVGTFFAATGRLAVRFRWAIVLAWVAGAAAAMALLPSLSSVTQSDNTSFLPASAPSEQAAQLASPLQEASLTAVTVVAARSGGTVTGADEAFLVRLGALAGPDLPRRLGTGRRAVGRRAGRAAHGAGRAGPVGRARRLPAGHPGRAGARRDPARRPAARVRGAHRGHGGHPGGHQRHLGKTGGQVQWFSIAFVIALLVAVFRSALAPLIAVLPAVVVVLAGRTAYRRGRGARPGCVPDRLAAADRAGARRGHGLRLVPDVPGAGGDAGRSSSGGGG